MSIWNVTWALGGNTHLDRCIREGPYGSFVALVGFGKRLLVEFLDGTPGERRSRGQERGG